MQPAFLLVEIGRLTSPSAPTFRDEAWVKEFMESIESLGLQQPLVVRPLEDASRFEIVDGLLRFQALRALDWERVPVVFADLDERKACLARLVINAARRAVSPLEEARLVRVLVDQGERPAKIAASLGRSRDWLRGRLELLERLETTLQREVERGELTPTVALEIAGAPPVWQERLRKAVKDHGLSAYATGRLARVLADSDLTREERESALALPKEALARAPHKRPSPTPLADQIADLTRGVLDLERAQAERRGLSPCMRCH